MYTIKKQACATSRSASRRPRERRSSLAYKLDEWGTEKEITVREKEKGVGDGKVVTCRRIGLDWNWIELNWDGLNCWY